ncbi:anaerobic ribonucleoside-triphosphate reductase activating protein [Sulfuricella sp.]|uniref:anaerobic ribonucleoside-triphosphate reductase activating protein n=1 Tax=Sulfuricella sp. TaxID=2099377 RepID=UPI002BD46EC6|nr:anaerobic ribonucleoside-triphosphate reductase activating protein [Sulfuricella sp.]HUX64188.1 anaerobic ribonucleoside-triphosphate reductase activating protein [Sulfuricella sp.]
MSTLQIGGLTPLTSTDYPGCLAAVVFCQGCPWRCGYCHNPHLIPRDNGQLDWSAVMNFLHRRQGLLDAVVFSGGEPTLQNNIQSAISEVRDLGFKIGLHTGGTYPSRLKELLPSLDWVGMDIKACLADYAKVTNTPESGDKAWESAGLLLESGIPHEFRTTAHPLYHTPDSILRLAEELRGLGAKHYVLQEFRPQGCADAAVSTYSARGLLDDALCSRIGAMFETFSVRYA